MFFKGLFRRLRLAEASVQVVCTESNMINLSTPSINDNSHSASSDCSYSRKKIDNDAQIMNILNNICTY